MTKTAFKKEEDSFRQEIRLKRKEKTSKMLHSEHRIVQCWNLDTSDYRTEVSWKYWNVGLEKIGRTESV